MDKKPSVKFSWWEKLLLATVPPLIAAMIKLLCLSCRVVKVEGRQQDRRTVSKHEGRAVYCTWHQRMFYHFHYFGSLHVTMMISRSKDGQWAERVAHFLGFKSVRGSSRKGNVDKGGSDAWRQLVEMVRQGQSAGMLADGPQGPPRVAKIGSLLIGKMTGAPVIPEMWGCDRAWVFNSWDRYMIPKPFAKICILHGEPIYVPPDADEQTLEEYRLLFEQKMNQAAKQCDDYFGIERPVAKQEASS